VEYNLKFTVDKNFDSCLEYCEQENLLLIHVDSKVDSKLYIYSDDFKRWDKPKGKLISKDKQKQIIERAKDFLAKKHLSIKILDEKYSDRNYVFNGTNC